VSETHHHTPVLTKAGIHKNFLILAFARMEGEYRWTVYFSDKKAIA
jgi:hypothetical protein